MTPATTARADDIVLCEPLRSPIGAFGGALAAVPVEQLAGVVLRELMRRTGLEEGDVDDVVLGQCYANAEAPALGRVVALVGGLGVGVPGCQVDRRCGSGLQAILQAAMQVATGAAGLIIAGGAESMSRVEHYALLRAGARGGRAVNGDLALIDRLGRARVTAGGPGHPLPSGMIETAENLRRQYGIARTDQDALALSSQQRWAAAQTAGRFAQQIVAVPVPRRGGTQDLVEVDEHPRPDSTAEGLARLRPMMQASDPEATVTAGNASGQNDGAALCVVTTRAEADRRGLDAYLALRGWAVAGLGPEVMGLGPVPATARALERAGLGLADLDLIELNEAFAAQVLACLIEWDLTADDPRLNVNGSGISLGHPVGATGARILTTLAHEMRRRGGTYALETMCIGGGQGLAAVFESVR